MTEVAMLDQYGALIEPATLTIARLLPGPIERCWDYLTRSDMRRQWLAAGDMKMAVGAPFELVWRNDELTDQPGRRPDGFSAEHRMQSKITALDPPRKLSFSWQGDGEVSFELEPHGDEILLTVIHRRVPDRAMLLNISAGWHMHLDTLVARATGKDPAPFWEGWARLKREYDARLPA